MVKIKKMTKIMIMLFAAVFSSVVFAADLTVPSINKSMPPDGKKDVKIHFYIDGHRRNKDANMRKETSYAYIRAINALREILTDRNNPIDEGLRQRGIGKNVEVNTGNAFLLMPDRIVPFSLSKKASESDFGKFGPEESAWDRNVLVKQILENEKNSENIVVCIISNDPSLSTKHGSFYLDEDKGIMFFMLHAQRESVNGSIFHPYWSVDEWASFLREAMGTNANDIANVIVDSYYALSEDEEDGLKEVISTPSDESIAVKKIRSIPQKKMWKSTLSHNGVEISKEEDVQTLSPKNGQNKIVVQILSPTGVSYARSWEQDSFFYRSLNDDGQLYSKAKDLIDTTKDLDAATPKIAEVEKLVQNPKKPIQKEKFEELVKTMDTIQAKVDCVRKVHEVKNAIKELDSKCKEIGTPIDDYALSQRVKKLVERLEVLNKGLQEDIQIKVAENFKKEADELKAELAKIEKDIAEQDMEKGRSLLLAKIEDKRAQARQVESNDKKCNNLADLDGLAGEAKRASDAATIKHLGDEVNAWVPKFVEPPKKPDIEPVVAQLKPVDIEPLRAKLKTKVQGLLDDSDNAEDKIENREELKKFMVLVNESKTKSELDEVNRKIDEWKPIQSVNIEPLRAELKTKVQAMLNDSDNAEDKIENREELNSFMSQLDEAKTQSELEEIKGDIEIWERLSIGDEGGFGVLSLLFVLIVLGVLGFFVIKLLSGKSVATISFQKTGSTDAPAKTEAKLNKQLRFDESLDCEVDIRATPKRNEAGSLEFDLVSPNKTVWLLKLGNDKKKQINEIPVSIEEGVYQVFDNEIAMQPMGKAEFKSIESM